MLILTRKSDESIIIGNNIEIKVLKLQGNQVHLGINAPRDVSVYRQEIYEQIRKENEKAVQKAVDKKKLKQIEANLSNLKNLFFSEAKTETKQTPPKKSADNE